MTSDAILRVEGLEIDFLNSDGIARAVDGVSLHVGPGETLGMVGESGCGKSLTALSILGLVPCPPARIGGGAIRYGNRDLMRLTEPELRRIRGNEISMIFQEPMTSLNPVLTIGEQITEALVEHRGLSRSAAQERATEVLELVRMSDAKRRLRQYPHELSGGMRQRVMIAMALACDPKLLIADEPTTALDVTIQAQILTLMAELQERLGTSIILITHDLGVVAEMAHRVIVMYAGRKVEEAPVDDLFAAPLHPYTRGLLGAMPTLEGTEPTASLHEIPGMVPSPRERPTGCVFAPRCHLATARCTEEAPELREVRPSHTVACWHADHG
jgi:peptide/nickel transport system ATP-binding protein